ncbi:lasso peptide biosynthesis B2 protein [Actinomadura sp. J1-007]|nr:lasso peptide biosynthesis B2 protein [Actinomadura sp. J1-007]
MTMPMTLEETAPVPLRRRLAARPAVALAAAVERLPPRRMRRVLLAASRGARPASGAQALAARQAVVAVSVHCAGQGCLRRSLATALLCRLGGTWPDWCTGVRAEPFRAHAWVEAEGTAVGEQGDTRLYHKTMTVPARPARPGRSARPGRRARRARREGGR